MDLSPGYSWVSARCVRLRIQERARVLRPDIPAVDAGQPCRTPHIDRIGISYMYLGLWKPAKDGHEFHVGPHLMVVGPHQDEFSRIRALLRTSTVVLQELTGTAAMSFA